MSTAPSTPIAATTAASPGPVVADLPVSDRDRSGDVLIWGLTAAAWVKVLIVSALLVALFRFNLARLWAKTNPFTGESNWGHSWWIPLVGLYYLYLNRDQLLGAEVKPIYFDRPSRSRLIVSGSAFVLGLLTFFVTLGSTGSAAAEFVNVGGGAVAVWGLLMLTLGWGLGNILFGMLVFAFGIWPGKNDWVSDYGMVHTVFGVVLTLCGWQVMRVAWFPIAFLICALPWPGLFYSKLAGPLQTLAAYVAVHTLKFTGIDAFREGTKMFISTAEGAWRPLNVAEACAGLRSLMTFISLAAAVGFLSNRALWQKVVITLSAIPIAIFCNVLRVTGQAYIDRLAGPQWSENFAHQFVGVVMLIPAFFLILGVAWALDQIFVEEADDKPKFNRAPAARATEKKVIVVANKAVVPAVATPATVAALAPAVKPHAAAAAPAVKPQPTVKPVAKPQPVAAPAVKPQRPAAPAAPPQAAPARPAMPAPPPPARMPPRTNLTGRPATAQPRNDRPTEGA